jgi:acetoin utilization deacetylase AcuC-like enzyme
MNGQGSARAAVGIVDDARFLDHNRGAGHIEGPERLEAVREMIAAGLPFSWRRIEPRPATDEELRAVHSPAYLEALSRTAGQPYVRLDADTSATALSFETARLAAGAAIAAADAVLDGTVSSAVALLRPPGHHAERDRAMGFCLINNIAVAAEHLIRARGLGRVLVVDWDLHHGNGTQRAFWARKDVLYFSTHAYPYYPGSGYWDERGTSDGTGYTVNIPLAAGKGDREFAWIYREILGPIARGFRPEFVLVSAGFDIAAGDPLGPMQVTPRGFSALAAEVLGAAGETAGGRVLFLLEGGYDPARLAEGIRRTLLQASGAVPPPDVEGPPPAFLEEMRPALELAGTSGMD